MMTADIYCSSILWFNIADSSKFFVVYICTKIDLYHDSFTTVRGTRSACALDFDDKHQRVEKLYFDTYNNKRKET